MAEQIDLPVATGPSTTKWLVLSVSLSRGYSSAGGLIILDTSRSCVSVELIGLNGLRKFHTWSGAAADADIVALNKVNLTTNSLHRRILTKLITDGIISGTISGTPD